MKRVDGLIDEAILLLKDLIAVESFSGNESGTAELVERFLRERGVETGRKFNNVYARNAGFSPGKPTLLLNSHHDTVNPNSGWTLDPFTPLEKDGRLYGLGSNDAGASLVGLVAAFIHFHHRKDLPCNLLLVASAEEEISGERGLASVLPEQEPVDAAIVGEPTGMEMAVAEKGLMVLRCRAHGTAGHAARDVGDNAIVKAIRDIQWFGSYRFARHSPLLGEVKMSVTMIRGGLQHNVIPDRCDFTVDIRTTDAYSHDELLEIIRDAVSSEIVQCSKRLHPSSIATDHPLVESARALGIELFASATLSDQSQIPAPSVKIGPGMSERSHTADEFVYIHEIGEGARTYIALLERYFEILESDKIRAGEAKQSGFSNETVSGYEHN
ncbi:MAG: M20 family metallo-hydrolase [Chlorobi bacterium]|nr:M20 family metallo-hydrolase [Chlorobiota bacterium]